MRNLIFIFTLIILSPCVLYPQTSIDVGAGVNFPIFSGDHFGNLVRADSLLPSHNASGKSSVDATFTIVADFNHCLGKIHEIPIHLILGVTYTPYSWEENLSEAKALPSRFGSGTNETHIEHLTKNSLDVLGSQLGVFLSIDRIGVEVLLQGCIAYTLSSNTQLTYNLIVNPQQPAQFVATPQELAQHRLYGYSAHYLDDSRTSIVLYDTSAPELNSLRFGFVTGIRKTIDIFGFTIVPSLSYQYLPQSISKYKSDSIDNFSIGISARFTL